MRRARIGTEIKLNRFKGKGRIIVAVALLLCLCGNTSFARETEIPENLIIEKESNINSLILGASGIKTDSYTTPGTYTWTAPVGVTSVNIIVAGAGGGGAAPIYEGVAGKGGNGAVIQRTIAVTPGQKYNIIVGKGGKGGKRYRFWGRIPLSRYKWRSRWIIKLWKL